LKPSPSPLAILFYSWHSSGGFKNVCVLFAWGVIRYAHSTPGYRYFAPSGFFLCLDQTYHNDRVQARKNGGTAQALWAAARLPIFINSAGQASFFLVPIIIGIASFCSQYNSFIGAHASLSSAGLFKNEMQMANNQVKR
jgi:hypothetical protein